MSFPPERRLPACNECDSTKKTVVNFKDKSENLKMINFA